MHTKEVQQKVHGTTKWGGRRICETEMNNL
jgi:hypothetical protein